ncbi:MAG: helix-turn-helix transcriptional regulator, partial [Oscillospiraceae bacterium]|nr:helix-turn-helix transcriptional regulator [Oscillospiraceae bacterium]
MDINLVIAENCKRIRKIQKMSIERTAEIAGVSRSMLGQIERGEANPSAALLHKIAGALKVPMEELLRYEPETEDRLFRGIDSVADRADGGKVLLHNTTPYDG